MKGTQFLVLVRRTLGALILLSLVACAPFLYQAIKPFPSSVSTLERIQAFPEGDLPLFAPAEVYFNPQQIPFIFANDDRDLPFLVGMVQAHLRLGQMEFLRRVSRGELAEMFGPFVRDIDYSLRVLGYGRASAEIEQTLPEATHLWLSRFVEGVNHYRRNVKALPPEWNLLRYDETPWSVQDVITLSRLAATDVNWLYWFRLLSLRSEPKWDEFWGRARSFGEGSLTSFGENLPVALQLGQLAGKTGSNSIVVHRQRTKTGAALIANDPHVGLALPNLWLVVGAASPSYHSLGLMFPGLPMVLLGRNRDVAWGGTNMLAISSGLYHVPTEKEEADIEPVELGSRWWFSRSEDIRSNSVGVAISDVPPLAGKLPNDTFLYWRGHRKSDEFTAFLKMNRARNWPEFRDAFATYAVSGQNFLYADRRGNIGQLLALSFVPELAKGKEKIIKEHSPSAEKLSEILPSTSLPTEYNPPQGYLVSANNTPVKTDPALTLLANSNDRVLRMKNLFQVKDHWGIEDVKALQQDVHSPWSKEIAHIVGERLVEDGTEQAALLSRWTGTYSSDSREAGIFQAFLYHLITDYYGALYGEKIANYLLSAPMVYSFLAQDIAEINLSYLRRAFKKAEKSESFGIRWADLHRLPLQHYLGNVPVLGIKFRFGEIGVPGSSTTLHKSAHSISPGKHTVRYGANSRHVSDLSDRNENYFVLLGGQDGYFGSENYLDQIPHWQQGEYVRVPFEKGEVEKSFPYSLSLSPR